jgi:hypothetical protein
MSLQTTSTQTGTRDVAVAYSNPLADLKTKGFTRLSSVEMRQLIKSIVGDEFGELEFRSAWDGLGLDKFMADCGAYRTRSLASFEIGNPGGSFERTAPRPHFQALEFNTLNGGVERYYDQTADSVIKSAICQTILNALRFVAELYWPYRRWFIEFHQFRIKATTEEIGQPTPEGIHRDGVALGFIMLVNRVNIAGGTTTITNGCGETLAEFTLTEPFECMLLDDAAVRHGASAVTPLDPSKPAYRDTVVATFKPLV